MRDGMDFVAEVLVGYANDLLRTARSYKGSKYEAEYRKDAKDVLKACEIIGVDVWYDRRGGTYRLGAYDD